MAKRIAINGFGRIGRLTLRNLLHSDELEVVAINDLTDNKTLAHLFKYDSAQGSFPGEVSHNDHEIIIDGKAIRSLTERNPAALPWKEMEVDLVLECTGIFRTKEKAGLHLEAGAKRVLLSAPAKSEGIQTIVLGVNDHEIDPSNTIFSNASCTTNCLAPVIKTIEENWGFEQGTMTTIHGYTADQRIQDAPHADLRRARAAAINIVPTTTGAAIAVAKVYPAIEGKLNAMAVRVPVVTGSLIDLSCLIKAELSLAEVNAKFKEMAGDKLKGILQYTDAPLVSSDIIGNPHSSIFDSSLTKLDGKMLKVIAWYDNEAGYSARLADSAHRVAKLPETVLS